MRQNSEEVIKKVLRNFPINNIYSLSIILLLILAFGGMDIAGASGEQPFNRLLYVNEWGGALDTTAKIDKIISDAVAIKADAIAVQVGSEYFEATRDPVNKLSWDVRAKPTYNGLPMLEYFIKKAHANNIQVHAWSAVSIVSGSFRAEYKLFGPSANYPYNIVTQSGSKIKSNSYYRLDISFKGLQDYEIGLYTWVAKNYPTLDGLHIEEPVLLHYSYSTAVREKVKTKYGYDPLYPGGRTQLQVQKDITDIQRDSWNTFFTRLRNSINANKANPNFQLSANSWIIWYSSATIAGLDPQYLAKNNLIDWYSLQIGGNTMDNFGKKVQDASKAIPEIPIIATIYPYYHSPSGNLPNPVFFDRAASACSYGADAVGIFSWVYLAGTLNGQNIINTLRGTPTSSCGTSTVPTISPTATPTPVIVPTVATPTLSSTSGTYSGPQSISISTSTIGATIHYTVDGTTPTEYSPTYSGPIIISSTKTLKARAWKAESTPSAIVTATYTISSPDTTLTLANINNAGFESGDASWTFYTNGLGTFSITSPGYKGNNAAKLYLKSSGSNIQLYQTDIKLEPNTQYRLSFSAYSTTGHGMKVRLIQHDSPYDPYGLDFIPDMGTSWQTFTTEFTTSDFASTVNDARLMFYIGDFAAAEDIYYIDDVQLEKVIPPEVIENSPTGTNVSVEEQITVEFSEAMDKSSVQSSFSTIPETTGDFSWSGNNMTYTPLNLSYNTVYNVIIGNEAKDLSGTNMVSPYNWQFTTDLNPANLLSNQGFESGSTSWLFYTGGSGTFGISSPGHEGNNAAKLALSSSSTNIQLYQTDITLEANTLYRLSFTAYSTTGRDMVVNLVQHDSPYTYYGLSFTPDLGTGWQTFTTEFRTRGFSGTVNDGRLMFQLAQFAAARDIYYIDDIRLEKINDSNMV